MGLQEIGMIGAGLVVLFVVIWVVNKVNKGSGAASKQ